MVAIVGRSRICNAGKSGRVKSSAKGNGKAIKIADQDGTRIIPDA